MNAFPRACRVSRSYCAARAASGSLSTRGLRDGISERCSSASEKKKLLASRLLLEPVGDIVKLLERPKAVWYQAWLGNEPVAGVARSRGR